MKATISNKSGGALDLAKRIMYSLQVLLVGLFILFTFVFGISYNRHIESPENGINISKPNPVIADNTTVDLGKVLSDQNS